MPTRIALLRGINIGGRNKIRMTELKAALARAGMSNIRTYLQSGNVILEPPRTTDPALAATIEKTIRTAFGQDIIVLVRTPASFGRLIRRNPFAAEARKDPTKVSVTFLSRKPSDADLTKLKALDSGNERFAASGSELFLYCPDGFGRARFTLAVIERNLAARATSRNYKTVMALHELTR